MNDEKAALPEENRSVTEKIGDFIERTIRSGWFSYFYMVNLLVLILLCGYVLIFSGSLFIEAVYRGWWRPDASEFDNTSLFLGYLFGFPSLLGVIGTVTVLATNAKRMYRFKVLFFVPAVVWTTLLVLDIVRRSFQEWYHLLYLLPSMILSSLVLYCVVKKVRLPYHD